SSLAIHAALSWALGRGCLGLLPARPLTSLLIQAENDDQDLVEMRDGVLGWLDLTDDERQAAVSRVYVCRETTRAGPRFCDEVLRPLLEKYEPDLSWLDPMFSYLGGEANDQGAVSAFLRNGIAPLLDRHRC